ncbi:hypothetical protein ABGB12_33945 [Actinocorallia sp. B10E7]|uniref:hypothetical protein n=1 Tax=Actinocorallia sp. B10E7 TaxID=3153558 RepID=UPI00325E9333
MKSCRTAVAGLVLGLVLVAGCGGEDPEAEPSPTPTTSTPTQTAPPDTSPEPTPGQPEPEEPRSMLPNGYVPLWPFSGPAEARSFRPGGYASWNLDAGGTALSFTRSYLGFTGIDRITSRSVNGTEARIGVGFRAEGRDLTAAVIHLFRVGGDPDGPWEVVGTDDTTLSLTTPAYGGRTESPATLGGRITGVDESLQAKILHPRAGEPLGEHCCTPAGGQDARWRLTLPYEGEIEKVATIVVWTGGHVADVERFAVTGIRP